MLKEIFDMTAQITQPIRLSSRPSDLAPPVRRAILFTENLQLPGLIDAIVHAIGLGIQLTSARLCGIGSIGQHPGALDAAIIDLPFDISETEISHMIAELRETFPLVRVLLISGYPVDDRHPARLLCGGAWFLNKPFTIARLAATMRAILEGNENREEDGRGLHDNSTSLRLSEGKAERPHL